VVGAAAPPPPPPVDPSPVVVAAGDDDPTALAAVPGSATDIAGFVIESDRFVIESEGFVIESDATDWRLSSFRSQWGPAAERLLAALTRGFAADGGLVLRFWSPF
jgi:hypothetical protein